MTRAMQIAAALGAAMMILSVQAVAQEGGLGEREYRQNCLICHGESGKGDGYLSGYVNVRVADLTQLAKQNGGVFPFERVYEAIDGRSDLETHGLRDMPVWGDEYDTRAIDYYADYFGDYNVESFIRGRIIALISYIDSLQVR